VAQPLVSKLFAKHINLDNWYLLSEAVIMRESHVYIIDEEGEKLIAEEVASMAPKCNGYVFVDIYGNRYEVNDAEVAYIDFIGHKVVLKKRG
jgi:predicted RNA-binding protein